VILLSTLLLGCGPDDSGFTRSTTETTPSTEPDTGTPPRSPLDQWADAYALPTLTGQPDVVLVTIDTLRADALSPTNTPNLLALFETGLWLSNHHASSNWTSPTMTAILAGRDPLEVGYFPTRLSVVPEELTLLATALGSQGYETFACTTNGVLGDAELIRDYDHIGGWNEDSPADEHIDHCLEAEYSRLLDRTGPVLIHTHFLDPHDAYRAPVDWIEQVMVDLYGEVLAPLTLWGKTYELDTDRGAYAELELRWPEYDEEERALLIQYMQAIYLAEVRFLDDELPRLFEGLEEFGLDLSEAVVMVATDHGEQLFDRGYLTHARTLFPDETGALAFIAAPGFSPFQYQGLTTHKDLLSLLYPMLGLSQVATSGLTELDGAPRITTGFQCAQSEAISPRHPGQQAFALHSGGLRLIATLNGDRELYDRRDDPEERNNVYDTWDEDPSVLEALEAAVEGVEAQAATGSRVCLE
jgi:arylsulfatase A-like enzyme